MAEKKPDSNRGFISFALIIIAAIIIGDFLKNVRVGLLIGLALGFLGANFLRKR